MPLLCARAHTQVSIALYVTMHLSVHPCTNYHRPSSLRIPLFVIAMAGGLVQVDVCEV
jgi:hypothetical protein